MRLFFCKVKCILFGAVLVLVTLSKHAISADLSTTDVTTLKLNSDPPTSSDHGTTIKVTSIRNGVNTDSTNIPETTTAINKNSASSIDLGTVTSTLLNLTVNSDFATMRWHFDASLKNTTFNFTVSCTHGMRFTEEMSFPVPSLSVNLEVNLTNLIPGTKYKCNVRSDPELTFLGNSTFHFQTELSVSTIHLEITPGETFVMLRWNETKAAICEVTVTESGPQHFIPDSCVVEENPPILIRNISESFYNYTEANPDYEYIINVKALNFNGDVIGEGNETVLTKPAAHDAVRDLHVGNSSSNTNETFISYPLFWKMPCSPNGNITYYNITIDGRYSEDHKITHHTETFVMAESNKEDYNVTLHLQPSHQYSIGVAAVSENFEGKWSYKNFTTSADLPCPPNVTIVAVTDETITVQWQEACKVGEILKYLLEIKSEGPVYSRPDYCRRDNYSETWSFNKTKTLFIVQKLNPDTKYHITVTATTIAGSRNNTTEAITLTQVPEQVKNIAVSYPYHANSFISTNISWELPCLLNGPYLESLIKISSIGSSDPCLESLIEVSSISNSTKEHFLVVNLNYSTKYTVEIWVRLENEQLGREALFTFTTPPGLPGKVTISKVISRTNSFDISWIPPQKNGCSVTGYQIGLKALEPAYNVSSDCIYTMTRLYQYPNQSVNGSVTQFEFEFGNHKVFPYYVYEIAVTAKSNISYGDTAVKNETYRRTAMPDSVKRLNHSLSKIDTKSVNYTGQATIIFEPPCYLNGPLICYTLEYTAVNKSEGATEYVNITGSYTFDLMPDYLYNYRLTTHTKYSNRTSEIHSFRAPAGVPKFDIAVEETGITRTQTTAKLTLMKKYFDENNGKLKYIAMLLANSSNLGGQVSEYEHEDKAAFPTISKNEGVQVKVILQNPFEEMEAVEVVIGNDSSYPPFYYNNPLEANRDYYLIIRAYNNDFYKNSGVIHFKTDDLSHLDVILGILFAILFLVLAGLATFFLWRKKWIRIPKLSLSPAVTRKYSEPQSPTLSTSYPPKKFLSYYKHLENNPDLLKAQFATLKKNSLDYAQNLQTHFAKLPENRRKNRYTNISPFDETRVKLMIDEDDEIGSDYINASYIRGYTGEVEYIATQGPLESTCRDFWKMILQENVSIIVMVSLFIEQDKIKCYRYFPRNHETMLVGEDIEVKCYVELHFGIYCVRTLQIKKDNFQTHVTHMQFLEWPDFGVPTGTEHMLQFCNQMRDRIHLEEGVIVVHCSAGVGRTGTLIATDILIQAINAGKNIDVFSTVEELRKQRMHMVQTEEQYFYIHKLLVEHLDRPQSLDYSTNQAPMIDNLSIIATKKSKSKLEEESKF